VSRQSPLLIPNEDNILANWFAREEDRMTSVDSNFCGRPHGDDATPCVHATVHLSLTPIPLRVDVINRWPLMSPPLPLPFTACLSVCLSLSPAMALGKCELRALH